MGQTSEELDAEHPPANVVPIATNIAEYAERETFIVGPFIATHRSAAGERVGEGEGEGEIDPGTMPPLVVHAARPAATALASARAVKGAFKDFMAQKG